MREARAAVAQADRVSAQQRARGASGPRGRRGAWGPAFVRAVFSANFARDEDISARAVLEEALTQAGADADAVLARAESPENKLRLREQTTRASQLGIFGAPDFIVKGELFFGQDRLEDALEFLTGPR